MAVLVEHPDLNVSVLLFHVTTRKHVYVVLRWGLTKQVVLCRFIPLSTDLNVHVCTQFEAHVCSRLRIRI